MKYIKYIIIFVVLFSFSNCFAIENIYDYAFTLSDSEEIKLNKKIDKFTSNSSISVAIISSRYYEYETSFEYATEFYNKNLSGDYIIFILDYKDNDINMFTFGNAGNKYPKSRIKSIINNINSDLSDYKKCNIFIRELSSDYSISIFNYNYIIYFILSLIMSLIITLIIIKRNKVKVNVKEMPVIYEDLNIDNICEKLVTTHTYKNKK